MESLKNFCVEFWWSFGEGCLSVGVHFTESSTKVSRRILCRTMKGFVPADFREHVDLDIGVWVLLVRVNVYFM